MMKFIQKHPICSKFLLGLLIFYSIVYGGLYFFEFRYDDDRFDSRYYAIPPLSEKWTKVIEYKTVPLVKFGKCLILEVNKYYLFRKVSEKYYDENYSPKYNFYKIERLTPEESYLQSKDKPHFSVKIYKDNKLIHSDHLYFLSIQGYYHTRFQDLKIITDTDEEYQNLNKAGLNNISLSEISGYKEPILSRSSPSSCYRFEANTQYKIEITNENLITEYDDVEIYFSIRPVLYK